MARILFEYALPIALPTIIYLIWLTAARRRKAAAGTGGAAWWQEGPWLWLLAAGLVLAGLVAAILALMGRSGIEGRYVPPHSEGGRVVPGHIEPRR